MELYEKQEQKHRRQLSQGKTLINVVKTETPESINIKITGHAGYAKAGYDIICASVSILFYTLHLALASSGREVQFNDEAGEISVKRDEEIDKITDYFFQGFVTLSENYPQNVAISTVVEG